jgi:hypothetical protein
LFSLVKVRFSQDFPSVVGPSPLDGGPRVACLLLLRTLLLILIPRSTFSISKATQKRG